MTKVSIVTPIYNQADFLPRTAESILSQSGPFELEWIIWDDGSTDRTPEVIAKLSSDRRVRAFRAENRGQCQAINDGMRKATGDIAAWLNSDDLYTPGALAKVVEAFANQPHSQWLLGRCDIIDTDDRIIRPAITRYKNSQLAHYGYRRLLRENFVSQPATFWRLSFWRQVGDLDESLYYTMDYDTWLRMGRISEPLILSETLAQFRLHPKSKTGAVKREQFDEEFRVAQRYLGNDNTSRMIHRFNVEKIVWSYRLLKLLGK
ncbi:MAG TPA: glycosyltransferase [Tepidisphaeraceae bacterium]|jgi:glycosyltransferase involved in cell wall biosynthesis